MLTTAELTDARERLGHAKAVIEGVKGVFLGGAYIEGVRNLNEACHCLIDQLCILDREIGSATR